MTLIKSISGIRGTIGGRVGDNLTPVDIVKFASAYALFIKKITGDAKPKIVVGRDARMQTNRLIGHDNPTQSEPFQSTLHPCSGQRS